MDKHNSNYIPYSQETTDHKNHQHSPAGSNDEGASRVSSPPGGDSRLLSSSITLIPPQQQHFPAPGTSVHNKNNNLHHASHRSQDELVTIDNAFVPLPSSSVRRKSAGPANHGHHSLHHYATDNIYGDHHTNGRNGIYEHDVVEEEEDGEEEDLNDIRRHHYRNSMMMIYGSGHEFGTNSTQSRSFLHSGSTSDLHRRHSNNSYAIRDNEPPTTYPHGHHHYSPPYDIGDEEGQRIVVGPPIDEDADYNNGKSKRKHSKFPFHLKRHRKLAPPPPVPTDANIQGIVEAGKLPARSPPPLKSMKPPYTPPTFKSTLKNLITCSYLNILLLVTPFAITSYFMEWNGLAVFILNLVSLIPLANLMGFVTEEIVLRLNHILGAILSCTLGNSVEFITGIMALRQSEYEIIQMTMLGVILANTMLIVGISFFVGGCKYRDQYFNITVAHTSSALMGLGVLSMIIPAAFTQVVAPDKEILVGTLALSRGTSVILMVVYVLYLVFQLRTHIVVLKERNARQAVSWEMHKQQQKQQQQLEEGNARKKAKYNGGGGGDSDDMEKFSSNTIIITTSGLNSKELSSSSSIRSDISDFEINPSKLNPNNTKNTPIVPVDITKTTIGNPNSLDDPQQSQLPTGTNPLTPSSQQQVEANSKSEVEMQSQHSHKPQLLLWVAIVFLFLISICVSLTVEILVHHIEYVTEHWNVSKEFVGQIILPVTICLSERLMTIMLALKNEMDITICMITGSSTQVTLFILPLLVVIAWGMGHPLTLKFDGFETTVMLISVLVINYIIVSGRSNWLKGIMLISAYMIVALAFFYYPVDSDDDDIGNGVGIGGGPLLR
ncbi:hypothetical protein H4219_005381 [Mycoemilia scoparia]|uniref:Sodium/calcium exchanger membrane region domain-containing protein n=1 Tax=Mycoemilia scoparia TaxID=417184 RepID=A0A9W7ZPB4_9FUNG|nr:hypothetical protein H4219_005381 [Mycoemilia scoparia]